MKKFILSLAILCALIPAQVSASDTYSAYVRVVGSDSQGGSHILLCTTQVYTSSPFFCNDYTVPVAADVVVQGTRYHKCTSADRPLRCATYVGRFVTWVAEPGVVTATCHLDAALTEVYYPLICQFSTR